MTTIFEVFEKWGRFGIPIYYVNNAGRETLHYLPNKDEYVWILAITNDDDICISDFTSYKVEEKDLYFYSPLDSKLGESLYKKERDNEQKV